MPAKRLSNLWHRPLAAGTPSEITRGMHAPELGAAHPIGALRGLMFAGGLALPFWGALYLLLR